MQPEAEILPILSSRLASLDQLCREYGAGFRFLVPPTGAEGDKVLAAAGNVAHVRVLIPVASGSLTSSNYESDGFHLNSSGRLLFTSGLVQNLRAE